MTWKEANKYKQKYGDNDYNASGIIRDDPPNEGDPSEFNNNNNKTVYNNNNNNE